MQVIIPSTLRRQAWGVAGIFGATTAGMAWGLSQWGWDSAESWFIFALLCLAGQLWLLHRFLPRHHPPDSPQLLPNLGWANALTLTRGLALGWLAGFLSAPRPEIGPIWLPASLYTAAACLDIADGIVARLSGAATGLGGALDLELDALGILIVCALVVRYGQVPVAYGVIGLARYIFVLGVWLREKRQLPVHPIPPSLNRRAAAGLQMGLFSVLLWPNVAPPATWVAALVFGLTTLAIFGRDWLVVIGCADPAQSDYQRRRAQLLALAKKWLPLLCRGICLLLAVTGAVSLDAGSGWGRLGLIGLVLAVGGVVGRLGGLLLIAYVAFACGNGHYPPANLALLACACWLVSHGSGAFALWQPEEVIFERRFG